MKALLILLVVLGGVWLWRSRQTSAPGNKPVGPQASTPQPLDMVRCAQCGIHVPGNEAIAGKHGVYCSVDHQHQSES